jgi:hypothetical protein
VLKHPEEWCSECTNEQAEPYGIISTSDEESNEKDASQP